jgi:hypothetical protein
MNSNFKPTETEQKILSEARYLLGNNLADYLLSGLGETNITDCRAFIARSTSHHGQDSTYRFEIINESEEGLPIERDPLVLAVLLDTLREQRKMDDTVTIKVSDILETFRCSQTPASELLIKQAIERYVSTTYCLIDPPVPEGESRSRFRRLIIEYETISRPPPVAGTDRQSFIKVTFFPSFIYSIIPWRKFLGIEFHSLTMVREIPCESSEGLKSR